MMTTNGPRRRAAVTALCSVFYVTALLPTPAYAQVKQQAVKLSPADGCFRYSGDAVEFVGRFKAGSYIGVAMNTLDASGFPLTPEIEPRISVMDAPEFQRVSGIAWFGPLPESRVYSVSYMPRAEFGSFAIVTICGRTSPPAL